MIIRVSFCSHVNKVVLSEKSLTQCTLNKLAGPFLFSPLGPRCVSCQKGNCQVHFVVNSHILCKWHNILLHSLEKHFHNFTHPMFFLFCFTHPEARLDHSIDNSSLFPTSMYLQRHF